jgi:hypothetical protein
MFLNRNMNPCRSRAAFTQCFACSRGLDFGLELRFRQIMSLAQLKRPLIAL